MSRIFFIFNMIMMVIAIVVPLTHAQSVSRDSSKASDVKKETQELISAMQNYSVEQRDKALKEAKQAIEKLDNRISDLESRIDKSWDSMNKQSREAAKSNLKALRLKRTEVAESYGSLKTSSGNAWTEMKKGFSDAYQAVSHSWEKATNEFDKNNK